MVCNPHEDTEPCEDRGKAEVPLRGNVRYELNISDTHDSVHKTRLLKKKTTFTQFRQSNLKRQNIIELSGYKASWKFSINFDIVLIFWTEIETSHNIKKNKYEN